MLSLEEKQSGFVSSVLSYLRLDLKGRKLAQGRLAWRQLIATNAPR